ncbi:MAG: glucose-6-phosphate isomerase [Planctomycetota bacterium]
MNKDSSLRLSVDFTNFTERALGMGRGLLQADLPKIEKISVAASEAVKRQHSEGKLPYLDLHKQDLTAIKAFAADNTGRYDNIVVLGIGGSALGLIALRTALGDPYHYLHPKTVAQPRLFVFDNIDPWLFGNFLDNCDFSKSLFFVISKSGSTAETMTQYLIVKDRIKKAGLKVNEHIVAITDPVSGTLHDIAKAEKLITFPVPEGVGGRFSVLTPVGLAPAAVAGMDIERLLKGAGEYVERCLNAPVMENPSLFLAAALFLLTMKGYTNHVMMPYSNRLKDVADWYRQLWAESLGKRVDRDGRVVEVGPTPIKALGATDQHSQVQLYAEGPRDKAFMFEGLKDYGRELVIPKPDEVDAKLSYLGGRTMNELIRAEMLGTIVALTDSGRPNCLIELDDVSPETVSQLFLMWEMAVSYIGELMNINAYDQPGVEAGKIAAYALMGRSGYEAEAQRINSRTVSANRILIK